MIRASYRSIVETLSTDPKQKKEVARRVYSAKRRYEEIWRHHHNAEHPQEMFGLALKHRDQINSMQTFGWSIVYHDIVYDPGAPHGRNEELSALLAEQELTPLIGRVAAGRVAHLTRETVHHTVGIDDPDLDLFMDIDCAVLGASRERYDRYAAAIRTEYVRFGKVPMEQYALGRQAVLQSLASRTETGIFRTDVIKNEFESRAQENIARELEMLRTVQQRHE